jgi:hypothetical protein
MVAQRIRSITLAALLAGAATLSLTGCPEKEGPAEKLGEAVDEAAEKAGDAIDPKGPAEKAGRAVDKALED